MADCEDESSDPFDQNCVRMVTAGGAFPSADCPCTPAPESKHKQAVKRSENTHYHSEKGKKTKGTEPLVPIAIHAGREQCIGLLVPRTVLKEGETHNIHLHKGRKNLTRKGRK